MSHPAKGPCSRILISLMYNAKYDIRQLTSKLIGRFGGIHKESAEFRFDFTRYYEKEFGNDLIKKYMIFSADYNPEGLPDTKHWCYQLEQSLSKDSKRSVNIDPGYVTENSVILASFKARPHRIYLDRGVYADLQLVLENKEWKGFSWTFPDILKIKEIF